MAIIE